MASINQKEFNFNQVNSRQMAFSKSNFMSEAKPTPFMNHRTPKYATLLPNVNSGKNSLGTELSQNSLNSPHTTVHLQHKGIKVTVNDPLEDIVSKPGNSITNESGLSGHQISILKTS
jgi:hypothetical protein